MSSTRHLGRLAIAVAAIVVCTFAVAGAASGKSSRQASFTLVAIPETQFVPIERGYTWTDRLETTKGQPIDGWDGGRCLNLNPDPDDLTQYMCDMVVRLPKGDITATVVIDVVAFEAGEEPILFAVTGGTRAFRNARGTVEVVEFEDGTRAFAIFRLLGVSADR